MRRAGSIVRRGWPIAALLLLAAVSAAVARDAAALHRTFERSDLAFKAQPSAGGLWKADTRLPFVERAFAVEEDLDYRRALRAFALDVRRSDNPYDFNRPAFRADAQATLSAAERSELEPALRSKAASLQGILVFDEAVADPVNGPTLVGRSIADFRRAVGIDPRNEEAKYNLEFVLRLMEPSAERLRIRENIPAYRTGRSAPGAAPPRRGHGY